jgi:hypothetical protein
VVAETLAAQCWRGGLSRGAGMALCFPRRQCVAHERVLAQDTGASGAVG